MEEFKDSVIIPLEKYNRLLEKVDQLEKDNQEIRLEIEREAYVIHQPFVGGKLAIKGHEDLVEFFKSSRSKLKEEIFNLKADLEMKKSSLWEKRMETEYLKKSVSDLDKRIEKLKTPWWKKILG